MSQCHRFLYISGSMLPAYDVTQSYRTSVRPGQVLFQDSMEAFGHCRWQHPDQYQDIGRSSQQVTKERVQQLQMMQLKCLVAWIDEAWRIKRKKERKKKGFLVYQQHLSHGQTLTYRTSLGPSFQLQKWPHANHALTARCSKAHTTSRFSPVSYRAPLLSSCYGWYCEVGYQT